MNGARAAAVLAYAVGLGGADLMAQNAPEANKIYVLGSGETLTELSLESGTVKASVSKLFVVGVAKTKTFAEIPSTAAPLRIKAGAPHVFIIGTVAVVPERLNLSRVYATLVTLDVNDKSQARELVLSAHTGSYGVSKDQTEEDAIPLNFSRFGDHAIKIQPRSVLLPGEYAFGATGVPIDPYAPKNRIFYYCFGVD